MQTTGSDEAGLAQHLVQAGIPVAVGMAFSVTVSAAELAMPELYRRLVQPAESGRNPAAKSGGEPGVCGIDGRQCQRSSSGPPFSGSRAQLPMQVARRVHHD